MGLAPAAAGSFQASSAAASSSFARAAASISSSHSSITPLNQRGSNSSSSSDGHGGSSSGGAGAGSLDLFSRQSALYAKYRPSYPAALFEFVASLTKRHERVWDVGTGSGQAAVELASHYSQVIATDISAAQISRAKPHPNITYAVTPADVSMEKLDSIVGPPGCVDLVTVAQAMHWFDFDRFNRDVRRALRPSGGAVAAWSYELCRVNPSVDEVIDKFYVKSHPFWEPQRRFIDEGYRTIPFDFKPIPGFEEYGTGPVKFEALVTCKLEGLFGFLDSWSATQTAREQGVILLDEEQKEEFAKAWGDVSGEKKVTYPINMRIGTI